MLFARPRILLVAFIALLQCFVPLIHAHAHEMGPSHIHSHVFEPNAGKHAHSASSEIKASTSTSAAIGVSSEYKRERFLLPIIGAIAAVFLAAVATKRRIYFSPARRPAVRSLFHNRPPATAPPVLAAQLI